ncbi:fimbrial protein [Escherichia coli]|uniref:fimbrial protein n=1 Tax=Escherichia coli TaxID=562 RepID=UPI0001E8AA9B|nr:fimbrial protein [Escherichia coli]
MSLRVWMVTGGMMLMCGWAKYAISDDLIKENIIHFQVYVNEPSCQILVPDIIDFGDIDSSHIAQGVEKNFTIKFKNCTQRIPKPSMIFSGEQIESSGGYIKNKSGPNSADGVGISLIYQSTEINLKELIRLEEFSANEENNINLKARLKKTGDTIKPGNIDTNVTLNVYYY